MLPPMAQTANGTDGSAGPGEGNMGILSSKPPSGISFSMVSLGSIQGGATFGLFGLTPANKDQTV